jgi:HEXXH motif-containing protein
MNLPHHQLSRQDLIALATGGGADAVRELAAVEYSKHMTFLWGVVATTDGSDPSPLVQAGYDLLAAALRKNRDAAATVIRYPSVGAWARQTAQSRRDGAAMPEADQGQFLAVAAAAAIRAGLPVEVAVPATDGRVLLPSLGTALVSGPSAVVRSGSGGATVDQVEIPQDPSHDAPGWLGLRQVRVGRLNVSFDDLDPFRMPGVQDLAPRAATDPWADALGGAWRVLEHGHTGVAADLATLVSAIVPLSRPPSGEVSSTSPDAFGAIALSLPPDDVTGAETLAHEVQHLKLGALLDVVTLTLPDDGRRYYAPWRDDPRPLDGLLQGAYAYLGVSGFWRRQRELPGDRLQAEVKYARWRAATARAVGTLGSSGRLTETGQDFVSAMAHTIGTWQDEPVPPQAVELARRAGESHLVRWEAVHGPTAAI